ERGICSGSRSRRGKRLYVTEHRCVEASFFLRKSKVSCAHPAECFENRWAAVIPGSRKPLAKQLEAAACELSHKLVAVAEMTIRRSRSHADALCGFGQREARRAALRN